jgi:anthranilate phosphoribosyltransferase
MKAILNKLYNHERLSKSEAKQILIDIAAEKYNDAHLASFMTVFMMRPITVQELSGFREALKELSIKVDLSDYSTIDIVGTGGDGKDTFNISTLIDAVALYSLVSSHLLRMLGCN